MGERERSSKADTRIVGGRFWKRVEKGPKKENLCKMRYGEQVRNST